MSILGSKADTLEWLCTRVQLGQIGEQVNFTVGDWHTDQHPILDAIREKFGPHALVVRSSALTEDSWSGSNAGAFTSVLDVPGSNRSQVTIAIDEVICSYGDDDAAHQVLVQAMLTDVRMHGVVLTRTLNYGPYYTVTYDDTTGSTETVTSGRGQEVTTVVVHRGHENLSQGLNPRLPLIQCEIPWSRFLSTFSVTTIAFLRFYSIRS
jgi:hypothetical protein